MDAFYASVEQRDNPSLKGKPVAVGGAGPRGVIAAASYEARRFGVFSAMPGSKAKRLCPDLVFVHPRFDVYKSVSSQIRALFLEITDLVEPLSLDEAYLDITHMALDWEAVSHTALQLKNRIKDETGLTATAGISNNKFLAKMASGENKPDGITIIRPEDAIDYISQLPIGKFFGVGKVTAAKMEAQGVLCGRDLQGMSELELATRFGKLGRYLFKVAQANDDRPVVPHRPRKSLSVERTYTRDLSSEGEINNALSELSILLAQRIVRADTRGKTIVLKVRYDDFTTMTRQMKVTNATMAQPALFRDALTLVAQLQIAKPVRLLGLGIADLEAEGSPQLQLDI